MRKNNNLKIDNYNNSSKFKFRNFRNFMDNDTLKNMNHFKLANNTLKKKNK